MELQQRVYDVDALWDFLTQLRSDEKRYELIDGELIEMSAPGGKHGQIAVRLSSQLHVYAEAHDMGIVTVETGHHPRGNRFTLLVPDVAFVSRERAPEPFPEKFVPLMPDLAVEIASPSDTTKEMREKAQLYLTNGTQIVWLVMPTKQAVEIHRASTGLGAEHETLALGDSLSGEDVLPGFELELRRLFA